MSADERADLETRLAAAQAETARLEARIASTTAWWSTAITKIEPGVIELRGYPVQQLIGNLGFVETVWLMTRGERPEPAQAALLEAALVASVDHGPQAPSIASARMAVTCGVGLNSAVANGVNVLGDTHGGAGQQCVQLLNRLVAAHRDTGASLDELAAAEVASHKARGEFVPGFGHRFHPRDPRRDPLLALVERARDQGVVEGRHLDIALAVEGVLASRNVPMNIDGVSAVVYGELGIEPELARGLFVLSRSVGILAHAWEEGGSGQRIKGPLPKGFLADYTGPATRDL
ncbi:citryl-CoA lyase [Frigoribacterium sp. PhB24]|uniref:citryl-CoA lyase n=1 Tax=Frigoribacterium sp. PhB24 TaxID=2485204 RepID=UPI000F4961AC|nr:citryl-CoA lyase [Frigoribacterium sp. PhB24]ROS54120.1 citrate synthase [Frigoribacterium sp. PhB24]